MKLNWVHTPKQILHNHMLTLQPFAKSYLVQGDCKLDIHHCTHHAQQFDTLCGIKTVRKSQPKIDFEIGNFFIPTCCAK